MELVGALARRPEVRTGFFRGLASVGGKVCRSVVDKFKFSGMLTTKRDFLVAAGVAVSAYGTVRVANQMGVMKPVKDVYNIIRVACGGEPKMVNASTRVATRKTTFESVRQGSVETKMPVPKNQAVVGELVSGEFHSVGCAVRMGAWLVMPAHVYAAVDKPWVKGKQGLVDVSGHDFQDLETDLIGIKLGNNDMSKLGLKDIGCYNDIPKQGSFSAVCGSAGQGTVGVVKIDTQVFGRITYDGTTVAGYSGAAYMSGSTLIGIHTSGGIVNGGYSAGYVKTLLQVVDKTRLESSEDWLQNVYDQGLDIVIDPKWNDLDEIRIQVGGKFSIVSRDSMRKAFGNEWQTHVRSGRFAASYGDLESGEARATSKSGGLTSLAESPNSDGTRLTNLMSEYSKLSKKQRAKLLVSLGLKRDMSTPPQAPESVIGNSSA